MNIREQNGFANLLYRIFIDVDDIENDEPLNIESNDATERELAKSMKKIDEDMKKHFSSGKSKGKSQFKVEESQLNKKIKTTGEKKKTVKEVEKDDAREM